MNNERTLIASTLSPGFDPDCVDALPLDFKAKCNLDEVLAAEEAMADDLVPPHELKLRKPCVGCDE